MYVLVPIGTILVGAAAVDCWDDAGVDTTVVAGVSEAVETTDVKGVEGASVLEAKPIPTVGSCVEVVLRGTTNEDVLSAEGEVAVVSVEATVVCEATFEVVGASEEESTDEVGELTVVSLAEVSLADVKVEDKLIVVSLDKGIEVEPPMTAAVVVPLIGTVGAVEEA